MWSKTTTPLHLRLGSFMFWPAVNARHTSAPYQRPSWRALVQDLLALSPEFLGVKEQEKAGSTHTSVLFALPSASLQLLFGFSSLVHILA